MASVQPTKRDLDDVQEMLEDAYHAESTRWDLAEAIGKALDALEGEDEEEPEDEEEGPEYEGEAD